MSFTGKVVIVTGSSSGIGAATAIIFAKEGAKVTIVGRNVEKLKKVEKECEKYKNTPLVIVADIAKDEEARGIVEKTVKHFGKLDVLVNNAGVASQKSIFEPDYMSEYDRITATNLRAVVLTTNVALPHLVKTKGNIINISSIAGIAVGEGISHYCASKAGLDHFSRAVAVEAAPKGIRVNNINPGPVKTDIFATMGAPDDYADKMGPKLPLGFMTQSEEVGNLVKYLASDLAKSITGSSFVIDGGILGKGMSSLADSAAELNVGRGSIK